MKQLKLLSIVLFLTFIIFGCGSNREVVENNSFKVINNLSTGLVWKFVDSFPSDADIKSGECTLLGWKIVDSFPVGADIKPGECTLLGLADGIYTVELKQCNIDDAACSSYFGATSIKNISIGGQINRTLLVNETFFEVTVH